jgi:hypothetical protein
MYRSLWLQLIIFSVVGVLSLVGETIDRLVIEIKGDIMDAVKGIDRVDREMDELERNTKKSASAVDRSTKRMSGSFVSMSNVIKGTAIGAVLALTASLGLAGKAAFNTTANMEQYMVTLETLYGSQKRASEQLQWILDFAKETPFEIPGLVDSTIKLKAYGLEAQDVLETLGDTAAGTSKPIDQVVNAYGRLAVGDTGQAIQMFRDLGVNIKAINGLQFDARGSLVTPVEKAMPLVREHLQENFGGLMEDQSETLRGTLSNIADTAGQAALALAGFNTETGEYAEGGIYDRLRESANGFLEVMNKFDFSAAGESIRNVFSMIDKFMQMIEPARQSISEFFGSAKGIIADFRRGLSGTDTDMSSLAVLLNILWDAFAKVFELLDRYDVFELVGKGLKATLDVMKNFFDVTVNKFVAAINLVIDAYNTMVPGLKWAGVEAEKINKITFEGMTGTVEKEMKKQEDLVKKSVDNINNSLSGGAGGSGGSGNTAGTSADGGIPSWAGKGNAYTKPMLEASGARNIAELRGLSQEQLETASDKAFGSGSIAINPASGVAKQAVTPPIGGNRVSTENRQNNSTGKLASLLENINQTLKDEPRKVDMDIDMDVEYSGDIWKLVHMLAMKNNSGFRNTRTEP